MEALGILCGVVGRGEVVVDIGSGCVRLVETSASFGSWTGWFGADHSVKWVGSRG